MFLVMNCLSNQKKNINHKRFSFKRDKNLVFDFRDYRYLTELFRDVYYKKFTTEEAERRLDEFAAILCALKKYSPKKHEYIKEKKISLTM